MFTTSSVLSPCRPSRLHSPEGSTEEIAARESTEPNRTELIFFTPYKPSPAQSLLLSSHAFTSPQYMAVSRRQSSLSPLGRRIVKQFDIVGHLPLEIVIKIFLLLEPSNLCRVCVVCRKWYQLSRQRPLARIRRRYVNTQRDMFQQSKENYGVVNSPQRLTAHHYTIAPSPLNTIQPTTGCRPPSSSRYRTPSPTLLLEEVGGLRLNDHNEVRRCLFPDSLRENNNCHSDPYEGSENVDCYTATIGKKSNRNRLKRL